MLKVGELFASIHLDDKDFKRGVEGSGRSFGGLVSGVAKGGLVIAGALAGVGVAGGALAFKLANVAGDMNESLSKVNVVFGDQAGAIKQWSESAAGSLGISQQAALEAAGTYGNLFRAMGLTEDKSAGMSIQLVNLASDLGSFNNMDPTEVLDKLRAGLTGETEPLKTLGVNLTAARIEEEALRMGLAKEGEELSAAAKAQASYSLIMKDTALAQGDFARTSDGMANQQRILKATFEDTMAGLGQAAVPIFEAILPMLTEALQGVADWASENSEAITEFLTGAFTAVGETISWLAENVIPLLVAGFTFFAEEVVPLIAAAVTWIAEELMPVLIAAFSAVVGWISDNWPTISSIFGQVFGAIGNVVQTVWPIIEAIASVLFPLVAEAASLLFSALDGYFKLIGGIFEVVGEIARDIFRGITRLWDGLGDFFGGVWDGIASVFKGGINLVIGLVNGLIGFLNNIRIGIPRVEIPGTGIGVGGGYFDPFNIGYIPYLASGVRNFRGGLAVVGEAGPELVALPRGADVYSNREMAGMGGVTLNMTVQPRDTVDAYDIGIEARRAVRLGLRAARRSPGRAGA